MVLPMGSTVMQRLTIVDKDAAGHITIRKSIPVRFTPLETVQ
jgi:protein-L-isoaspartate O-methyltransferase